jgi:hypothetical protein
MRLAAFTSVVTAWLALAGAARGEVHVVGITRGTPLYGTTVATGYTGWVIRLLSDSGNISGIDVYTGVHGLYGPMVQRWTSWDSNGVYDQPSPSNVAQNLSDSEMNLDSHLLLREPTNILGAIPWYESLGSGAFAPSGSAVPPFGTNTQDAGFGISDRGGFIKAVTGVPGPIQSSTLDIAYLVVPSWLGAPVDGIAPDALVVSRMLVATQQGTFPAAFSWVPEPATLGPMALAPAAVTLHWRRRRE